MQINITLTPEGQAAARDLATMPQRLMPAIARGLDGALEVGMTQATKKHFSDKSPPSPSPATHRIGLRSGLLRASLERNPARIEGGTVTASVGSAVKYWLPHELGAHDIVAVQQHTRRTARNARGERITLKSAVKSRAKVKPTVLSGLVSAHVRQMNLPARHMLFTGLTEEIPVMSQIISNAVVREWEKGGQG